MIIYYIKRTGTSIDEVSVFVRVSICVQKNGHVDADIEQDA